MNETESEFYQAYNGWSNCACSIEGAPFHGLIQGNKSVDVILDCLQQDTTEAEIVNTMCKRFDGDRDIIAADVSDVIRQLKGIGAIDE